MNIFIPTRLAAAGLLAALTLTPGWSAAIYQKAGDAEQIELSNIDGDDSTQQVLVSENAAAPFAAGRADRVLAPANFSDSADANAAQPAATVDGSGFVARPSHTELLRALSGSGEAPQLALPTQQRYRELMVQQGSFNGGANGNLSATRKYLKVDRGTFADALSN